MFIVRSAQGYTGTQSVVRAVEVSNTGSMAYHCQVLEATAGFLCHKTYHTASSHIQLCYGRGCYLFSIFIKYTLFISEK